MPLSQLLLVILVAAPDAPREIRSTCMLGSMSGYMIRSSGTDLGSMKGRGYETAEIHLGGDTLMTLDHTRWSSIMALRPDGGSHTASSPPMLDQGVPVPAVKVRCEPPGVTVTLGHATVRLVYSANPRRLEFDRALVGELQRARSSSAATPRERTRLEDLQTLLRELRVSGSEQASEKLAELLQARLGGR